MKIVRENRWESDARGGSEAEKWKGPRIFIMLGENGEGNFEENLVKLKIWLELREFDES
jgi:hypothetical protein